MIMLSFLPNERIKILELFNLQIEPPSTLKSILHIFKIQSYILIIKTKKVSVYFVRPVGVEPTTNRLRGECSTN